MSGGRFSLRRHRQGNTSKERTSNSLHDAFDQVEQAADAQMERLIEQMKSFEGTGRGASDDEGT